MPEKKEKPAPEAEPMRRGPDPDPEASKTGGGLYTDGPSGRDVPKKPKDSE
jgi:hypothetical protein